MKAGDDTAQGFDAWNAALWEESADFFYKRAHDADMIDITLRNAKQIRPRKEQAKDAVASAMWAVSLALEVIDKPKKYSSVDPAEWAKKALDGRKLKMHADAGENVDCLFAYGYLLSCAMVPNHDNFFERDEGTAFTWFLAAAKRGHCAACYKVGHMYFVVLAVGKDTAVALEWWKRAARGGSATAHIWLSKHFPNVAAHIPPPIGATAAEVKARTDKRGGRKGPQWAGMS